MDWITNNLDWFLVALLGILAGITDIITRYKDEPRRALFTPPGVLLLVINAAASIVALALIRVFGWVAVPDGTPSNNASYWQQVIPQVVAAGLGAILILRSSITVKMGEQSINVGLSEVVENTLAATQNALDRKRAVQRDAKIRKIVNSNIRKAQDFSFEKAYEALPAYALGLMQNLSDSEKLRFAEQNEVTFQANMPQSVKMRLLLLSVMTAMGESVLEKSVESLEQEITVRVPIRENPQTGGSENTVLPLDNTNEDTAPAPVT
ncbi:MAG TPA: hypothetical protein VF826_03835 [Chloroflexia bacterium]